MKEYLKYDNYDDFYVNWTSNIGKKCNIKCQKLPKDKMKYNSKHVRIQQSKKM